jgi:hypothetical protein
MRITKEIKKSGIFRLPSFPAEVPGILSISNEEGIRLVLCQHLFES